MTESTLPRTNTHTQTQTLCSLLSPRWMRTSPQSSQSVRDEFCVIHCDQMRVCDLGGAVWQSFPVGFVLAPLFPRSPFPRSRSVPSPPSFRSVGPGSVSLGFVLVTLPLPSFRSLSRWFRSFLRSPLASMSLSFCSLGLLPPPPPSLIPTVVPLGPSFPSSLFVPSFPQFHYFVPLTSRSFCQFVGAHVRFAGAFL